MTDDEREEKIRRIEDTAELMSDLILQFRRKLGERIEGRMPNLYNLRFYTCALMAEVYGLKDGVEKLGGTDD
jgi:hypothetical protein